MYDVMSKTWSSPTHRHIQHTTVTHSPELQENLTPGHVHQTHYTARRGASTWTNGASEVLPRHAPSVLTQGPLQGESRVAQVRARQVGEVVEVRGVQRQRPQLLLRRLACVPKRQCAAASPENSLVLPGLQSCSRRCAEVRLAQSSGSSLRAWLPIPTPSVTHAHL
jgi:hypothetical protein